MSLESNLAEEADLAELERAAPAAGISPSLILLFALSTGVIIVNLFAPQTLIGVIGPSLGFSDAGASLVAMVTLLGYAAGLFFLVPLGDLVENRRLVLRLLGAAVAAAFAAAAAPSGWLLLVFLFLLGAACSAIQILVPVAASMSAPEHRGRVIGNVMSGLMVGILLSRPVASMIADGWGWRSFYVASGVAMAALAAVLAVRLPERRPEAAAGYGALIASLWHLLRDEPVLCSRAFSAAMAMGCFSLFWTVVALRLTLPPFGLDQAQIGLFALVGAGGAVSTSYFGRIGDRGLSRRATVIADLVMIAAMALAAYAGTAMSDGFWPSLVLLGVAAVMLDVGVTGDQTLGRRAINLLRPEARGRLNGLFVGVFFLGGALGSAIAGPAWSYGGWLAVCGCGGAFALLALVAAVVKPLD